MWISKKGFNFKINETQTILVFGMGKENPRIEYARGCVLLNICEIITIIIELFLDYTCTLNGNAFCHPFLYFRVTLEEPNQGVLKY